MGMCGDYIACACSLYTDVHMHSNTIILTLLYIQSWNGYRRHDFMCYLAEDVLIIQLLPCVSNALIDIDECQEDLASCNPLNSLCSNTNGSYLCPCLEGFSPSNGICEGEVNMHLLRYSNL